MLLRIKELREQNTDMDKRCLAKAMGVTLPCIYRWENGQAIPSVAKLPKLARIFGVSIEELYADGDNTIVPEKGA